MLSALFGWLKRKYSLLPRTIGLLLLTVVVSALLVLIDLAVPGHHLLEPPLSAARLWRLADETLNFVLPPPVGMDVLVSRFDCGLLLGAVAANAIDWTAFCGRSSADAPLPGQLRFA
ncbi:hypothetical protein JQ604_19080 [Bradyrhizobium jicamae]|nr:hypothetical protein [Bradyrhizobium jicamae]